MCSTVLTVAACWYLILISPVPPRAAVPGSALHLPLGETVHWPLLSACSSLLGLSPPPAPSPSPSPRGGVGGGGGCEGGDRHGVSREAVASPAVIGHHLPDVVPRTSGRGYIELYYYIILYYIILYYIILYYIILYWQLYWTVTWRLCCRHTAAASECQPRSKLKTENCSILFVF